MQKNFHFYTQELTLEEKEQYLEVARGMVNGEYREFVTRLPALQEVVDNTETKPGFIYDIIQ